MFTAIAEASFPAAAQAALLQTAQLPAAATVTEGSIATTLVSPVASSIAPLSTSGDSVATPPIDQMHFADHGWFVVPSVANETGQGVVADAADGDFTFDVAAGYFVSDFFLV